MEIEIFNMTYKITNIKKEKSIRIVGSEFMKNNLNKGNICFKNKKLPLKDLFEKPNNKGDKLKIKIVLEKNSYKKNFIFENCKCLLEFSISSNTLHNQFDDIYFGQDSQPEIESYSYNSDYSSLNDFTEEIYFNDTTISLLTTIQEKYKHLSDCLYKTNKNITNMSKMFYECSSLKSLPDDISKWNTDNVIDMSKMFCKCSLLNILPDISKWNVNNVTDMKELFYNCKKIKYLPDISQWKTEKVIDMSKMFYDCKELSSISPKLEWNTKNVIDMNYMFYHCDSLNSFPDISKWDTTNVSNMNSLFFFCPFNSFNLLPDISN